MRTTPDRAGTRVPLTQFLRDFARVRSGLRSGVMFGMPAVYAGRRLVACVMDDGLVCRLTRDDVRGKAVTVSPFVVRGRTSSGWRIVRPRGAAGRRDLTWLLELAAARAAREAASGARPRRERS